MLDKLITILFSISIIIFMLFSFLFCMDREVARQDYIKDVTATGCIFQVNCDYYNQMLTNKNE